MLAYAVAFAARSGGLWSVAARGLELTDKALLTRRRTC